MKINFADVKSIKNIAESIQKSGLDPNKDLTKDDALLLYKTTIELLESGKLRVAEKVGDKWVVNSGIKIIILLGFKYGTLVEKAVGGFSYFDKDTLPLKNLTLENQIRLVPGGSSIRCGTYIAPGTIIMPPAYINIGAYVDSGCMVDSHALVGSCAQVGKNVHISAASQIGGVLEPVGAMPVIIEDDVFIGGNCGVYDGVIIKSGAVLGSGVILNSSIPVYDSINDIFIKKTDREPLIIPENAVVVSGSRPITKGPAKKNGMHVYCPIIIKYRDNKTNTRITLEDILR
jgi:2,3,4,5-tetrahydropyridine-2,6-dicarboxylate N-succinyltransferase